MSENLLAAETSPYLRQHADNPVHWQSWNPAALDRAQREGKPILLSVGYAACHWCHVMAHESFENDAIAALMNDHFVSIKVDREERPDLDLIYQHALALMGEQGGWPLTMFLTPNGEPFWGGTYFPPAPRYGRPGFGDILVKVAEIYRDRPEAVAQNVATLTGALAELSAAEPGEAVTMAATDAIAERLLASVDPINGGIGGAPKFPQAAAFELLWRAYKRGGDTRFRDAVTLTLDRMCQGGIYDHLGGGFSRYSTDAFWLAPHFEKMLYDNAQMIELLTLVWLETGNPLYEARVRETIAWLGREMAIEGGGYAAALDADSEGEEGKFYVWTEAEIDAVLGDDAAIFKAAYDVTPGGNWEGKTILNRSRAARPLPPEEEVALAACRERLLAIREGRPRPGRDDKVLADWNGLVIAALARAGAVFGIDGARDAAHAAFNFVCETMHGDDGRLRHSWCAGRADHPATLDDYANMCRAALALHEGTGDAGYLTRVRGWIAVLDRHYRDESGGGYFFGADDVTDVIARTRSATDNPTPAGNGVLAGVFARLHYLTGEPEWRDRAAAQITAFSAGTERLGLALATLLNANESLQNAVQVAVIGRPGAGDTEALVAAARGASVPDLVLQVVAPEADLPAGHPARGKLANDSLAAIAYVCRGQSCSLPLAEPAALAAELAGP